MSKRGKNERELAKALGRPPTEADWKRLEAIAAKGTPTKANGNAVRAYGVDVSARKAVRRSGA